MKETSCQESTLISLPSRRDGKILNQLKTVKIEANSFRITTSPNTRIYIYSIGFMPEPVDKPSKIKREIIQSIKPEIEKAIKNCIIFGCRIFSVHPSDKENLMIRQGEYLVFIKEVQSFTTDKQQFYPLLNKYVRKKMEALGYASIPKYRKYVNVAAKKEVMNIYLYESFKIATYHLNGGIFLKTDISTKIIRNQTVLHCINRVYMQNSGLELEEKRTLVKNLLVGQTVMTNYGKVRYLKVDDVCFGDMTEIMVESEKINLYRYYQQKYDIELTKKKQPLLFTNAHCTHTKTLIPSQLCLMSGIPEDFNENNFKAISDNLKKSLEERTVKILDLMARVNQLQQDYFLNQLGLKLPKQFFKLEAKIIPPPHILFGDKNVLSQGKQSNFTVNNVPIFNNKHPIRLGIITLNKIDPQEVINYFNQSFMRLKLKLNISIFKTEENNDKREMVRVLEVLERKAKEINECNFCLIVLPAKFKTLYKDVKRVAIENVKIASQVLLDNTMKKKNLKTIALKVLLQITTKSGNVIWAAKPFASKTKIMVIAFYCSFIKGHGNLYYLGACSTLDDHYSQIFSLSKKYQKLEETFQKMKQLTFEALIAYLQSNGHIPEDIIVIEKYSHLVSRVNIEEFYIHPTVAELNKKYQERRPKMTYVHMKLNKVDRFFQSSGNGYRNVPAGTLLNNTITEVNEDEFFLVSHCATSNIGSIQPNNYVIYFNDSDCEKGIVECLLHSMCFTYANWTGSIKVPSLIKYASKLAKFDQILSEECPAQFRRQIYYI